MNPADGSRHDDGGHPHLRHLLEKPRWRGALHQWALVGLVPVAVLLAARAVTARQRVAVGFFVVGLAAMFAVSALYHRGKWSPRVRSLFQRLDHSTIFLAISGTYSAVTLLVLHGWQNVAMFAIVWGGTVVGTILQWLPRPPSRVFSAAVYAIVGWSALLVLPALYDGLGRGAFALLLAGGLAYTAGAVVYARRRPDPVPHVYGFHEVFHTCTLVGAAAHFLAIWMAIEHQR